jgi:uncharacterized protein YlxP (DUF503 family)
MTDEQIKEITIAMINNDRLHMGTNNEEIAQNVAKFINTLRTEVNK